MPSCAAKHAHRTAARHAFGEAAQAHAPLQLSRAERALELGVECGRGLDPADHPSLAVPAPAVDRDQLG
jgi:hypothetical protein